MEQRVTFELADHRLSEAQPTSSTAPRMARTTEDLTGPVDDTSALLNFLKIMTSVPGLLQSPADALAAACGTRHAQQLKFQARTFNTCACFFMRMESGGGHTGSGVAAPARAEFARHPQLQRASCEHGMRRCNQRAMVVTVVVTIVRQGGCCTGRLCASATLSCSACSTGGILPCLTAPHSSAETFISLFGAWRGRFPCE